MKARHYRDLQVWQRSMALARNVFRLTETIPKSQLFGLTSQMQRAAVSIPSNIAEGHGRLTDRSFAQFLSQARGSLNELETQIELTRQLGFAAPADCQQLMTDANESGKVLNALLTAVRRADHPR
ncbi:MAG: four helix bundle protein [Acidobacteriaceae bacterium]